MKTLLRPVDVRSTTGTEEKLTVSSTNGVVPRKSMNVTMFEAKSYVGHKLCWPDDLVINSLWAWGGGLGVATTHGIISSAYGVYRRRDNPSLHPDYLHRLVRSSPYHWVLRVRSKGVWISRLQLTDDAFLDAPCIMPPPPEQAAIVKVLAAVDRRVNRLVRAKRRLLALLAEQKQAVITHAVTRGLDPTAPTKPSGVAWLGEVPKHWEVKRLKYLYREVDERSKTGKEELLSVSHLTGVTPRSQKNITMFKAASYVGQKLCSNEDFVVNTLWAWMGAFGVAAERGIVSPAYGVYRPRSDSIHGGYLELLLRTNGYRAEIKKRSTGIRDSRLRLYPEQFLDMPVILPPRNEQSKILESIESTPQDAAADLARREIDLIREYRTRLVADVVTGKLDVRAVADALPDEPDDPADSEPDTEDVAEAEEGFDDAEEALEEEMAS